MFLKNIINALIGILAIHLDHEDKKNTHYFLNVLFNIICKCKFDPNMPIYINSAGEFVTNEPYCKVSILFTRNFTIRFISYQHY